MKLKRFLGAALAVAMTAVYAVVPASAEESVPFVGRAKTGYYELFFADESSTADTTTARKYSYSDGYADIMVSVDSDDTINKYTGSASGATDAGGIYYTKASVNDSSSLSATNRYILIKPKVTGKLQVRVNMPNYSGNSGNRWIYEEIESSADIVSVTSEDLASVAKAGAKNLYAADGTTTLVSKNYGTYTSADDLAAGHVYAVYSYVTDSKYSEQATHLNFLGIKADDIVKPDIISGTAEQGKYTWKFSGSITACGADILNDINICD